MDEKLRILKMIEEGKITAEQATELMSALGVDEPTSTATVAKGYNNKMFRIIVDSVEGDKVNIQFPVGVAKKIIKATGTLPMNTEDLKGFDLENMMGAVNEFLDSELEGDIVSVNAADGTTVRIFID